MSLGGSWGGWSRELDLDDEDDDHHDAIDDGGNDDDGGDDDDDIGDDNDDVDDVVYHAMTVLRIMTMQLCFYVHFGGLLTDPKVNVDCMKTGKLFIWIQNKEKLNEETKCRILGSSFLLLSDLFFLKMGDLTVLLCARPWVSEREKRVQRLKTVWSEVILLLPDQIPICFTF